MANGSTQLLANNSWSGVSQFPYIVPYGQRQVECDIYGPICQTGSITVGVSLGTTTSATILPCSSYLSAQSKEFGSTDYLLKYQQDPHSQVEWSGDWPSNFGRSPECKSYAQAYGRGHYTISGCGNQNSIIQTSLNAGYGAGPPWHATVPSQIPPGVLRYFAFGYTGTCCGDCSLDVSEVRLYYFPNDTTTDCRHNSTFNTASTQDDELEEWINRTVLKTASSLGPPIALRQRSSDPASDYDIRKRATARLSKRVQGLVGNGSIAVISGHTFTSPSLYLQILGTAAVNDECGSVGPTLINPVITFPPGRLSTWKPPSPTEIEALGINLGVGEVWTDPNRSGAYPIWGRGIIGTIEPLNVDDLICPTWGLGRTTAANGTVRTTIGPPFLPLMVPDMHAFTLDPTWSTLCTGIFTGLGRLSSFAIFDPPHALTPARYLVPLPTRTSGPANVHADPTPVLHTQIMSSIDPAKPANPPGAIQQLPTNTDDASGASRMVSPGAPSSDPARPALPALSSRNQEGISTAKANVEAEQMILPSGSLVTTTIRPHGEPASVTPPSLGALKTAPTAAGDFEASPAKANIGSQAAFQHGKDPQAQDQDLQEGGQIMSVDRSTSELNSNTYSFTGPAMTISDRFFTLVSQPDSGEHITDNSRSSPSLDVLGVTGYTMVSNPSGILIHGFSVITGSDSPTIPVNPTSTNPSGNLKLASFSTTVALQHLFTIGTQTFSANLNGLALSDADVNSGGSAQTIDDTVVRLGHSGALSAQHAQPTNDVFTLDDPTLTPNLSVPPMTAIMITAGGSAIIIYGTTVSLQPSGKLVVGSSVIFYPASAASQASQSTQSTKFAIDGLGLQVQSSYVVVDGQNLQPGAHGTTVSINVVNPEPGFKTLNTGGGNSTIPSNSVHAAVSVQTLSQSGQGDVTVVPFFLIFSIWPSLMLLL